MLFTFIRHGARRQALNATRHFSSSTNKLAAAEVKKLGVIGAGQMVSLYRLLSSDMAWRRNYGLTIQGPWYRSSSSSKSRGSRCFGRQFRSRLTKGPQIRR
jgi:hypothetical protein